MTDNDRRLQKRRRKRWKNHWEYSFSCQWNWFSSFNSAIILRGCSPFSSLETAFIIISNGFWNLWMSFVLSMRRPCLWKEVSRRWKLGKTRKKRNERKNRWWIHSAGCDGGCDGGQVECVHCSIPRVQSSVMSPACRISSRFQRLAIQSALTSWLQNDYH